MRAEQGQYPCDFGVSLRHLAGVRPPLLYEYPTPPSSVRLLFLGWNPPKPYGGFWSLDQPDNLRRDLHWILRSMGRVKARAPDSEFLTQFIQTGHYFVHSVKCWTEAVFPGFGQNSDPAEWSSRGAPLLRACVASHLGTELRQLAPERVCALGQLAYRALRVLSPQLDGNARPTQGRVFDRQAYRLGWPVLYTCFPSSRRIQGIPLREHARRHLELFLDPSAHSL